MKTHTPVLFAGLLLAGCVHRSVTVKGHPAETEFVVEAPPPLVEYEDPLIVDDVLVCEPVWDGHAWIELADHGHGPGCGHWFHHEAWHLYPETHVYIEIGYSHCGDTGNFFHGGHSWARVWDGCAFIFLRGHVHGDGCGHHFHHGCWNQVRHDHVWSEPRRGHFCATPPARRRHGSGSEHARLEGRAEAGRAAGPQVELEGRTPAPAARPPRASRPSPPSGRVEPARQAPSAAGERVEPTKPAARAGGERIRPPQPAPSARSERVETPKRAPRVKRAPQSGRQRVESPKAPPPAERTREPRAGSAKPADPAPGVKTPKPAERSGKAPGRGSESGKKPGKHSGR